MTSIISYVKGEESVLSERYFVNVFDVGKSGCGGFCTGMFRLQGLHADRKPQQIYRFLQRRELGY